MTNKRQFSAEQVRSIGARLGIDWAQIDLDQFHSGLEAELKQAASDRETGLTYADHVVTGKIAWTHLKENRDYYPRLDWLADDTESQV